MPVDFATLKAQVSQKAADYKNRVERLQTLLERARETLRHPRLSIADIQARVNDAVRHNKNWRGAMPTAEALDEVFPPPQRALDDVVVLAADGSQINPDPHGEVYFGLVNLGLVAMDRQQTPLTFVRSHLLLSELHESEGFEASVLLRRDLYERLGLAWAAALLLGDAETRRALETTFHRLGWDPQGTQPAEVERLQAFHPHPAQVVALTDGPLELWGPRREEGYGDFQQSLTYYRQALEHLQALGVAPVGYVDNPRADLVVRMLELIAGDGTPPEVQPHPWAGVRDQDLWGEGLPPGYRTPLFQIRAQYLEEYEETLCPHFFYLNVGLAQNRPILARVEVPGWVAQQPQAVDLVHAVLLWQGSIVPGRLYPYILHRAHETAVVTHEDRRQVTWMVQHALLAKGLPADRRSHKQRAKDDFAKRNRYER